MKCQTIQLKRGDAGRERISQQPWEIEDESEKTGLPPSNIREIVRREGPMRENVEREIRRIGRTARCDPSTWERPPIEKNLSRAGAFLDGPSTALTQHRRSRARERSTMKLSRYERTVLVNQFRILQHLDEGSAKHWKKAEDAFSDGYGWSTATTW